MNIESIETAKSLLFTATRRDEINAEQMFEEGDTGFAPEGTQEGIFDRFARHVLDVKNTAFAVATFATEVVSAIGFAGKLKP